MARRTSEPKWTALGCLLMLASAVLVVALFAAAGIALWRALDDNGETEHTGGLSDRVDTLQVGDPARCCA